MNKYKLYKPKFHYAVICKHILCNIPKIAYGGGGHVQFRFAPYHTYNIKRYIDNILLNHIIGIFTCGKLKVHQTLASFVS